MFMKLFRLLILFTFMGQLSFAQSQKNMTLVGNLPYDGFVNDVWGYVTPSGIEYALVGINSGVSIVSLADDWLDQPS